MSCEPHWVVKSSWTVAGAVAAATVGSGVDVGTGVGIGVGFGDAAEAVAAATVGTGVDVGTGVGIGEDNGVGDASRGGSISEGDGPPPPQATTAKTKAGKTINFQAKRPTAWIIDCF